MNDYIKERIVELQNAKTATDITEAAIYFTLILEQNELLIKANRYLTHSNQLLTRLVKKSRRLRKYLEEARNE